MKSKKSNPLKHARKLLVDAYARIETLTSLNSGVVAQLEEYRAKYHAVATDIADVKRKLDIVEARHRMSELTLRKRDISCDFQEELYRATEESFDAAMQALGMVPNTDLLTGAIRTAHHARIEKARVRARQRREMLDARKVEPTPAPAPVHEAEPGQ